MSLTGKHPLELTTMYGCRLMFLSIATTFLLLTIALGQGDEEVCLRKTTTGPSPDVIQGRPGKSGAPGPPGPKGSKGAAGQCQCNLNQVQQLNGKIRKLNTALEGMTGQISSMKHVITDLQSENAVKRCSVGLRDGRVRDSDITASSSHRSSHSASHGRLDYKGSGSPYSSAGWVARQKAAGQWIQVDLLRPIFVTGVVTQGKGDFKQWVTSYKISLGNVVSSLRVMRHQNGTEKVFTGNYDQNSYVIHRFDKPVTARYFRLIALTWHNHVALRLGYFSC